MEGGGGGRGRWLIRPGGGRTGSRAVEGVSNGGSAPGTAAPWVASVAVSRCFASESACQTPLPSRRVLRPSEWFGGW
eukprot:6195493-Pleurochrysis_carterae.AAC.2